MHKTLEVVAAVILSEKDFLCVQRGFNEKSYISHKWEFPGGKIETNELPKNALRREISEELEMDISVGELITTVDHEYPDFSIRLHAYRCSTKNRSLTLNEHLAYKWLPIDQLTKMDWAAADIPIVQALLDHG